MTTPDYVIPESEAAAFLRAIDPEADHFCFRTFKDVGTDNFSGDKFNGTLEAAVPWLAKHQQRGRGAFVVINAGGQRKEEIYRVRAVFADLDGAPLEPILDCALPPHMIVETSEGKYHAYWLVNGLDVMQFKGVQLCIAARYNADASVNDLPRVMRLPGFMHYKNKPFLSRIYHQSGAAPYTAAQILAEFPPDETAGNGAAPLAAPLGATVTANHHATMLKQSLLVAAQVNSGVITRDEALRLLLERRADYSREMPEDEVRRLLDGALSKGFTATVARSSRPLLTLDSHDRPIPNLANVMAYLRADESFTGRIWFCEFQQRIISTFNKEQEPREWGDTDTSMLTEWFQTAGQMPKLNSKITDEAVRAIAFENRRDECAEWLNSLVWDGVGRVEQLFTLGFGADKNDYIEAVSRCWMVSMVARVFSPGCKVDTMPVFESKQGRNKSMAIEALVGKKWFCEASAGPESKDFLQCMTGKLVIEMAELDKFSKTDVNAMKRVMSTAVDRYRLPYGKHAADAPRRSVFSGTTNRNDWNRDETGARRFWPVAVGHTDLEWIAANREQVFAEAVTRYKRGEKWWDFPEEAAKAAQDNSRQVDAWEEVIEAYLTARGLSRVSTVELLKDALGIEVGRWTGQDGNRVARCMTALGWASKRWRDSQGVKVRGWGRD